jgi:hypothetical protein
VPLDRAAPLLLGAGLHRLEVSVERRLDIDDELAPIGQPHDHVRPDAAVAGTDRGLLDEVAVLDHPRELGHAAQRELAPLAAHLRAAQGIHEIAGLGLQGLLIRGHGRELGADPAEGGMALLLYVADLPRRLLERLPDRTDELGHRLLPVGEIRLRAQLVTGEVLLREAQEVLAVAGEGVPREPAERRGQSLLRLRERGDALALACLIGL